MIAFLNERSLEKHKDWAASLRAFLAAAQELGAVQAVLFRDSAFFAQPTFKQQFNALGLPKEVRPLIRELVFGTRYYGCWRPDRQSTHDEVFSCAKPRITFQDDSASEAAERKLRDGSISIAILSAADSSFGAFSVLAITRVSSAETAHIPNLAAPRVNQWIASQRGYYDRTSGFAPRDFQTILEKEASRFRATGRTERRFGRRIFEEIETGRLCYVDEGHLGPVAHLEVFSARGEHLGTANIDSGDLDTETRINGRSIKL